MVEYGYRYGKDIGSMPKLTSISSVRGIAIHALIKSGHDPVRVAQRFGLKRDTVMIQYRKIEKRMRDGPPPPIENIATSGLNRYIKVRLLAAGFRTFDELAKVTRAHVLTPKGTFKYWLGPYSIISINMYMQGLGMPYRIKDELPTKSQTSYSHV